MIKDIIKKIALFFLPIKKTIVFESAPDFSDNTRAVCDEMIRRGLNKKYRFIWIMYDNLKVVPTAFSKEYGVYCVSSTSRVKSRYVRLTAKCLISCNRWMTSRRRGQISFYLTHGMPIKNIHGQCDLLKDIDYCLATSERVLSVFEYSFGLERIKFFSCGYPRNDVLTASSKDLKSYFSDVDFDKCIVWYPTYRQSTKVSVTDKAIPIIDNEENAIRINEVARNNRTLILLKPHFAQDVHYIRKHKLSNIRFINDMFLKENNIASYELVGSCDALITDYSSIYYDFLLCDKPIALVWEDFEEYRKNQGITPGVEPFLNGGEKIYNINDFLLFVERVANGIDLLKERRNEICDIVNCSRDGKNASRVVDFIVEKAKL